MIDATWLVILLATAALGTLVPAAGCLGMIAGFVAGVVMFFLLPWRVALATWMVPALATGMAYFAVEISLSIKARRAGASIRPRPGTFLRSIVFWPLMLPRSIRYWFARDEPLSPEADTFLADAAKEFTAKQEMLERDWKLGSGSGWSFDQTTGIFHLDLPDGRAWEADAQILGSYQASDSSWEWAWNNPHVEASVARDGELLKNLGTRLGLVYLQNGRVPAPDRMAISYFSGIGVKATDSVGAYVGVSGAVEVVLMLKTPRWIRP